MLTVRVPWPTIVFTIIMDWIMIGEFATSSAGIELTILSLWSRRCACAKPLQVVRPL